MVTSGFLLWQFQVLHPGAEGLVVVLFWLDLAEIFFLGHNRLWTLDLFISSPAFYHCTMATSDFLLWQFQVLHPSAEGLVVVLFWLDLGKKFFLSTLGLNWGHWISWPALYHCAMAISGVHLWQFLVLNSGAGGLVVVLFWLDLWKIFFWPHQAFNFRLWVSSPALYHCAMAISGFNLWQFQVFNSGAEGLLVVLFWFHLWGIFF